MVRYGRIRGSWIPAIRQLGTERALRPGNEAGKHFPPQELQRQRGKTAPVPGGVLQRHEHASLQQSEFQHRISSPGADHQGWQREPVPAHAAPRPVWAALRVLRGSPKLVPGSGVVRSWDQHGAGGRASERIPAVGSSSDIDAASKTGETAMHAVAYMDVVESARCKRQGEPASSSGIVQTDMFRH